MRSVRYSVFLCRITAQDVVRLKSRLYDIINWDEAVRREQSVPVLDRLATYLRDQQKTALPKSQYGQAIAYALNHWDELRRFTADGRLEIDNYTVERTLRLCAISRKNWLFVGSDQGGETAAICFSILVGAKRHQIEPLTYVRALPMARPRMRWTWSRCCPTSGSPLTPSTS